MKIEIKEIVKEYINEYNCSYKDNNANFSDKKIKKVIKKVENELENFYKIFPKNDNYDNFLKYYLTGIMLYKFIKKDKKFLSFLKGFLHNKFLDFNLRIEVLDFFDLLLNFDSKDLKCNLGKYGIYFLLYGILISYENIQIENSKFLEKFNSICKEYDNIVSDKKLNNIEVRCDKEKFEYIKEVKDYFYWYSVDYNFFPKEGDYYNFVFSFENDKISIYAKYEGSISISKVEDKLCDSFYKKGIQILDKFRIKKIKR